MPTTLDLERFLPYQLSVLSNRISQDIAELYQTRHALGMTEWRVIAVLAQHPGISAGEAAERTAMDKVAISRAVASLTESGRVTRDTHEGDRRRAVLRLTKAGQAIHDEVAPLALAYEQRLLEDLSGDERAALNQLLHRVADLERAARARGQATTAASTEPATRTDIV
ncbi:MAG: MarR family transcriptional regulator [Lysobacteraceae bacterium]